MFSALLIALREGVEAALVVGIVLVYLNRTGRAALARWVWGGVTVAALGSIAVAVLLDRWRVSQEGFEGLLMLLAGFFVVTMVWWMSRVARTLKKQIEQRVETYAQRATQAAGLGLSAFVLLMVLREGVEMVIILRAVEISSEGLGVWIGTALGLGIAIAVGLFFFKGTLRIPLARFFAATSTILMVVAVQLAVTGVHELSEAQWIPSSQREMAVVGPIVRHDVFFFVVILGVAAVIILREWMASRRTAAPAMDGASADRRRWEWELRKQRRWMAAAVLACTLVVVGLAADFILAQAAAAPPEAKTVTEQSGVVRLPLVELADSRMHFYVLDTQGTLLRFLAIRKPGGAYAVALDACQICGPIGYRQDGSNVICRNCEAAIYIPSIGDSGGCNPIAVPSRVEGGDIAVDAAALLHALPGGKH